MIGDTFISPGLLQDFYVGVALISAAALLGLSWESIKEPLHNRWCAARIAEERKWQDLREAFEALISESEKPDSYPCQAALSYLEDMLKDKFDVVAPRPMRPTDPSFIGVFHFAKKYADAGDLGKMREALKAGHYARL